MSQRNCRLSVVFAALALVGSDSHGALVSRWTFDGNAMDSVGGRHGTLLGDAQFSGNVPAGFGGSSLALDGTLDKMIYDVTGVDQISGTFTVAAWVNLAESRPDGTLSWFGTRFPDDKGFDFKARLAGNSAIRVDLGDGSSFPVISDTAVNLGTNVWHHVAVAVQPDQYDLFVDGVLVNHVAFGAFTPLLWDANHDIAIGAIGASGAPNGPPFGEDFHGLIDDVRVYSTALIQQEVQDAMTGAVPEPATMLVWSCFALLGTAAWRRKRAQQARSDERSMSR
jgi:hypothetical protein